LHFTVEFGSKLALFLVHFLNVARDQEAHPLHALLGTMQVIRRNCSERLIWFTLREGDHSRTLPT